MKSYRSFAADRRRIMPARRHVAKKNPVKERLTRDDLRTETDVRISYHKLLFVSLCLIVY